MRRKPHPFACMLLVQAALLLPCATLAQGGGMEAASQAYRAAVDSLLRSASRAAGVQLAADVPFVAGSDGEVLIANAAVAGADSLSEQDLQRGTNLLFIYVSSPSVRLAVPAGFYVVRLARRNPGAPPVAQFVAADGRVVAERRVSMSGPFPPSAQQRPKWKIKLTAKFGKDHWEVDIEIEPRERTAGAARPQRPAVVSIVVPLGAEAR